jgi:protein-tyrosine-phosphatase
MSRCGYAEESPSSVHDPAIEFPTPLTTEAVRGADVVITMGCGDACPIFPGQRYLDWELPDPAGKTVEQICPIR